MTSMICVIIRISEYSGTLFSTITSCTFDTFCYHAIENA